MSIFKRLLLYVISVGEMDKQRCVVPGCTTSRTASRHIFPKNIQIGCLWIKAVRSPRLINIPYDQVRKEQYRVCHKHFEQTACLPGYQKPKLIDDAVPILYLPTSDDELEGERMNISLIAPEMMSNPLTQSTLTLSPTVTLSSVMKYDSPTTSNAIQIQPLVTIAAGTSVENVSKEIVVQSENDQVFNISSPIQEDRANIPCTPKRKKGTPVSRRSLLQEETRKHNLTPKARRLYDITNNLKNIQRSNKLKIKRYRTLKTFNTCCITCDTQNKFFLLTYRNVRCGSFKLLHKQ